MARFTELPFGNEGLVLPSQQQTQQGLSALSNNLLQMRQYMEGEKDKRDQAYVDATTFAIDPTITENVQRQKMADDVTDYSKKVSELYKSQDSGYLRLNVDQQLKQQNLRNELVSKQAQRIAAQNAYAAQYKEFTDPKNRGLYKPDYFEAQAAKFKNGEIVTDFLDTYPINTKKAIADMFNSTYKLNSNSSPQVKNVGKGFTTSFQKEWSNEFLGNDEPTAEVVTAKIGQKMRELYNTDPQFEYMINQDIASKSQNDPELKARLSSPQEFEKYLSDTYADVVKPIVYKEKYSEAKAPRGGTTVNVGSGDAKPKNVTLNTTRKAYTFGGTHIPPIKANLDVYTPYKTMTKGGLLVDAPAYDPSKPSAAAETFKDAQIDGIVNRGGVIYAAISRNKMRDVSSQDIFSGQTEKKQGADPGRDETFYVEYNHVKNLINDNGYKLEGWENFIKGTDLDENKPTTDWTKYKR